MEHCMESVDYLKYYTDALQGNLVPAIRPYESKEEIGLELFERYAEIFVLLLKFYKQDFTYEQTHAHSLALYQKYREGSDSVDLTCRIEKRREAIVKLITSDNPDPDGIVFLQNCVLLRCGIIIKSYSSGSPVNGTFLKMQILLWWNNLTGHHYISQSMIR